jgi:SAM-dependent methyltransferase
MKRAAERPVRLPEELRRSWDRTYRDTSYRKLPWFSPTPYPWLRRAVEEGWLPRHARVLDLGCGAGTNALFLARSGFRTSGIDLAPGAIEAATRRAHRAGLRVDFRVGDVLSLPFPKGSFRGLVDIGCFHTLPIELRSVYARELARVLRPGGRYIVSWVAPEWKASFGPPHRPSLEEVAATFEKEFLFRRTEYSGGWNLPVYGAVLERRTRPRPPPR